MAYTPPNPNGQTTKANSAPVTLASDQNNALETGGNLAAIKTDVDKIPSQGQALAAASMPVVLPAAQITTLTPPTTVTSNQGTAVAITGGWPTISGETADTTGTFTNATQTTSITASSLAGYQAVTVSINGTYGTGTAVFEGSDDGGTTWYSLPLARNDSAVIEYGYTSLTNTNRMWTGQITGLDSFRVRSTAVASGTINVRLSISAAATSDSSVVQLGSALPAGSAVIGHVITDSGSVSQATLQTQTDTTMVGGVNIKEINAVAPLMGNGVTGTGSQRVTIASDNTAFAVNATLSAETTKAIGVVRTSDGAGNLLTSNSTTYTAKFGLDGNLLGTLGTAFSTAGKVDVKGADGDVFVRQATASNLNAQVVGNVASGSSASGNPIQTGGLAKTANPTAVSDGQVVEALHDKLGKQVVVGSIRDLKSDATITLTASTSETTLISQIASTFIDVYAVFIENTSATATEVAFRDTTGGTVRFNIYVPAGDTRGFTLTESAAWKQATVNTNWTAQCTTSVSSVKIAAMYVKNT